MNTYESGGENNFVIVNLPFTPEEWEIVRKKCIEAGETPSHVIYVMMKERFLS